MGERKRLGALVKTEELYHELLDELAPLPHKRDGSLAEYRVVVDEAGRHSTKNTDEPERRFTAHSHRALQHACALAGGKPCNLASFATMYHDTSETRVQAVYCDVE